MSHSPVVRPIASAALAITIALSCGTAGAADGAVDTTELARQIEALRQTVVAQQAQIEALRQALERTQVASVTAPTPAAAPASPPAATSAAAAVEPSPTFAATEAPRVTLANGRPTITSADGRNSLALRAIVQGDYGHYAQAGAGSLATDFRRGSTGAAPNRETTAARDLSDGMYFRRARLGVEGVFNRDIGYRLVVDFGGSGTESTPKISDAWINYTGFAPFAIQLGAFSPPANLDDGTTPEDSLFIESATPADLSRSLGGADGRLGLGIRRSGARWMGALTLTSRTVADAEAFDTQRALVGRVGGLVATGESYNVHLGASGTWVIDPVDSGPDTTGARHAIRFRAQPELRVDSTRLIDTGPIDAKHAHAVGIEFGASWRNLFVQAERFDFGIDRANPALRNPGFSGWYAEGSWILTGESRRYNPAAAAFQNPRPFVPVSRNGGFGAWELALRYSETDLDFLAGTEGLATPVDGVRGGMQRIWTVGVNWYLNANTRLMFNYLNIDVDRLNPSPTAFGAAPASPPPGARIGQQLDAYALRMQYAF